VSPPAAPLRASAAIRLETFAERVAKLHAQAGQAVLADRSRRELAAALRDGEAAVREALVRAPNADARDNYALLALQWADYREWAHRPATRENARRLRERTEEVAWTAGKGARIVQAEARSTSSASAVRAASAGFFAQRAAKGHLWTRWGIGDAALDREMHDAQENLARILGTLREASDARPEVAEQLQAAENQMGFMLDAARDLRGAAPDNRALEYVAKAGDYILEATDRLVALYEAPVA
jgi:hypothetical protein